MCFHLTFTDGEGGSVSILFNWFGATVLCQDVISGYLPFPGTCEVEKVTVPIEMATPHRNSPFKCWHKGCVHRHLPVTPMCHTTLKLYYMMAGRTVITDILFHC